MPRRIVTVYVCSRCSDEFVDKTDIVSLSITRAPSAAEMLLDLCGDCMEKPESVSALLAMTYSEGKSKPKQAAAVAPTADGKWSCPECDNAYETEQGLNQHRSRKHGVVSPTVAAKAHVGLVGDLICPECEANGVTFRCTKGQGLAAHRRSAHGVIPSSAKTASKPPAKRGRPTKAAS